MTTPADPTPETSKTLLAVRPVRTELEAYARRRIESLRRADAAEAMRVEDAMERAIELLAEAKEDADAPA